MGAIVLFINIQVGFNIIISVLITCTSMTTSGMHRNESLRGSTSSLSGKEKTISDFIGL